MKPTVQNRPNALPAPCPIRRGFEFRNVSFAYPGTQRKVLKNFNFRIEPGERIGYEVILCHWQALDVSFRKIVADVQDWIREKVIDYYGNA